MNDLLDRKPENDKMRAHGSVVTAPVALTNPANKEQGMAVSQPILAILSPQRLTKVCSRCFIEREASEFYSERRGTRPECKVCTVALVGMTKEQRRYEADRLASLDCKWLRLYLQYLPHSTRGHSGEWPDYERWMPIAEYEGLYEVSDCGRVRSLWFTNGKCSRRRLVPLVLEHHANDLGYWSVTLVNCGKHLTKNIHSLVCRAFRGPAPAGHICGHRDGNPSNNSLDNLEWITYVENEADKRRHGRMLDGTKNHQSKLNEQAVAEMRLRRDGGESLSSIARRFHIAVSTASKIIRREAWKHVP